MFGIALWWIIWLSHRTKQKTLKIIKGWGKTEKKQRYKQNDCTENRDQRRTLSGQGSHIAGPSPPAGVGRRGPGPWWVPGSGEQKWVLGHLQQQVTFHRRS